MKKLLLVALIAGMPYSAHASSTAPVNPDDGCCTSEYNFIQGCTHYYCTWYGTTTEYTDCDTCETSGTIVEKNGSYQPCGPNASLFSTEVGKCVQGAITTFCKAGQYASGGKCKDCPDGGTSKFGASSITDCYIPAGTSGTDATGTWEYAEDCYYTDDSGTIELPDLPVFPVNP